jgi:hypothetical protein
VKNSSDTSDALSSSGCAGATTVNLGSCGSARDAGAGRGSSASTATCRDACFHRLGLIPTVFADDFLISLSRASMGLRRGRSIATPLHS